MGGTAGMTYKQWCQHVCTHLQTSRLPYLQEFLLPYMLQTEEQQGYLLLSLSSSLHLERRYQDHTRPTRPISIYFPLSVKEPLGLIKVHCLDSFDWISQVLCHASPSPEQGTKFGTDWRHPSSVGSSQGWNNCFCKYPACSCAFKRHSHSLKVSHKLTSYLWFMHISPWVSCYRAGKDVVLSLFNKVQKTCLGSWSGASKIKQPKWFLKINWAFLMLNLNSNLFQTWTGPPCCVPLGPVYIQAKVVNWTVVRFSVYEIMLKNRTEPDHGSFR